MDNTEVIKEEFKEMNINEEKERIAQGYLMKIINYRSD